MELSAKTNVVGLSHEDSCESLWTKGISISVSDIRGYPTGAETVCDASWPQEAHFLQHVFEMDDNGAGELAYNGFPGKDDDRPATGADIREMSESIIDFIKIDAGSQPFPVSEEGMSLLRQNSPLVMYNTRQEQHFHLEMMQAFKTLGYEAYRLVPGIGCLAPVQADDSDICDLNLYFCKSDRANRLSANAFLIRQNIDITVGVRTDPHLWVENLQRYPYVVQMARLWAQFIVVNGNDILWRVHQEALSSYAISRMTQLPPEDRFQALYWAYLLLEDILREKATFSRLMSLARVSSDLGYRERTSSVVKRLLQMLDSREEVSVNEPFLAISERFEQLDPGRKIGDWCIQSFMEAHERYQSHSCVCAELAAASDIQPPPIAL